MDIGTAMLGTSEPRTSGEMAEPSSPEVQSMTKLSSGDCGMQKISIIAFFLLGYLQLKDHSSKQTAPTKIG